MRYSRYSLFLLPALLLLQTGCSTVPVQVNAYRAPQREFPPPRLDRTVAVAALTDSAQTLLPEEVNHKLSLLLRERGYQVVPAEQADYLLECWFTMDDGREITEHVTVHEDTYFHGHFRSGCPGYPCGSFGISYHIPYHYVVFCKFADLTFYDNHQLHRLEDEVLRNDYPDDESRDAALRAAQGRAALWQCSAVNCDTSSDLRWRINHLLLASFEVFAEDTRKQRTIRVPNQSDEMDALN